MCVFVCVCVCVCVCVKERERERERARENVPACGFVLSELSCQDEYRGSAERRVDLDYSLYR